MELVTCTFVCELQFSRGTVPICLLGPSQLSRGTVPIVTSQSKMLKTLEISTFPIVSWPHPNCHVGPPPIVSWPHPNCHVGPPQLSHGTTPIVTRGRPTCQIAHESTRDCFAHFRIKFDCASGRPRGASCDLRCNPESISRVTVLDGAEHVVFAARGPRMGAHWYMNRPGLPRGPT